MKSPDSAAQSLHLHQTARSGAASVTRRKDFNDAILSDRSFALFSIALFVIAILLLFGSTTHAAGLELSPADEWWRTAFFLEASAQTQSTWPTPLPPDPSAPAATITWVGGGSASAWLTASNWSPATVPGSGDIATFATNAGSTTIGIDMSGATNNGAANQIVGEIALTGGENKTIQNSSSTTAGTLTLAGVSGILLSNSSTFDLTIQNGSGSGTLELALAASGQISVTSTGTVTISSVIKETGGSRGIEKTGTGTLILSGANTYSGATTVSAGTLTAASNSALGSSTAATAGLSMNPSSGSATVQFTSSAPSIASLSSSGAGTSSVVLGNTAGGGSATTLTIGGNNASTAFSGIVSDGTGTKAGAIGNIIKIGTGTLTLAGNNTYTGTTTISAGTLQIGNGGTTGTLGAGAVTDNATLAFNRSDTFTVAHNISGTGALNKLGAGTMILTGNNTYSGTTTISAGTLQVGNGGTAGTLGSGSVTDNAALSFNRSNALSVSNLISGTGSVTQAGSGTTTLSASNTYTGATNVNAGKLLINGNQSTATGAVSVSNSGTVLGGTGTIGGAVTINSGAVLLGGDGTSASGTLGVSNNLTLNSGSIIELALGPSFSHSTLARTGTGARTWTFASTQQFTFIELSGVTTGTYQNVITGLSGNPLSSSTFTITNPGWAGTFSFDGNNIDLTLTAVPEPGTWAGASLALIGLLLHQRKRVFRRRKTVTC